MSRYASFISLSSRNYSEADAAKAAAVTKLSDILTMSVKQDKYEYTKDDEVTKWLRSATAIAITINTDRNGKDFNRVEVTANGATYLARLYGAEKELKPASTLTSAQIKKAEGGFCSQDGEIKTDLKEFNGKLNKVARIYLDYRTI